MQGSLEDFRIEELVSMLGSACVTGRLTVERRGQVLGAVDFERGDVVAAAAAGTDDPGTVLVELALLGRRATFRFDPAHQPTGVGGRRAVSRLLDDVRERLASLAGCRLPDPDAVLCPANRLGAEEVRITRDDWSDLIAIGTGCTVRELARRRDVTLLAAVRSSSRLASSGLVRIVEPAEARVEQVESLTSLLERAGRHMAGTGVR